MKEAELIKGCRSGDRKAQKKLYETYGSGLMALCLRYAQNREDAEEIFHDSMMKVYMNIEKFEGKSSLSTWINRVGINSSLDFLRRKKNLLILEHISDDIVQIGDSDTDQEISMEAGKAMFMLRQLAPNQQLIINMYVIDEMSHKEIAKILNISEMASRAQYSRAKRALAGMIVKTEKKHNV